MFIVRIMIIFTGFGLATEGVAKSRANFKSYFYNHKLSLMVGAGYQEKNQLSSINQKGSYWGRGFSYSLGFDRRSVVVDYLKRSSHRDRFMDEYKSDFREDQVRISHLWRLKRGFGLKSLPFNRMHPSVLLGVGYSRYEANISDDHVAFTSEGEGPGVLLGFHLDFIFRKHFAFEYRNNYSYQALNLPEFAINERVLNIENMIGVSYAY